MSSNFNIYKNRFVVLCHDKETRAKTIDYLMSVGFFWHDPYANEAGCDNGSAIEYRYSFARYPHVIVRLVGSMSATPTLTDESTIFRSLDALKRNMKHLRILREEEEPEEIRYADLDWDFDFDPLD